VDHVQACHQGVQEHVEGGAKPKSILHSSNWREVLLELNLDKRQVQACHQGVGQHVEGALRVEIQGHPATLTIYLHILETCY